MDFTIWTQPDCPFCVRAKDMLDARGINYEAFDISTLTQNARDAFKATFKTVPQVFNGDLHIGGFSDLEHYFAWADKMKTDLAIDGTGAIPYRPTRDLVANAVRVKRLHPLAKLPTRGSARAVGMDLYLNLGSIGEEITLSNQRGNVYALSTGIAVSFPDTHYLRCAPRSGLGVKGLHILAGVVDVDYRGELKVIAVNLGPAPIVLKQGDRVAQGILEKASILDVIEVDDLDATERGDLGFGSTGR